MRHRSVDRCVHRKYSSGLDTVVGKDTMTPAPDTFGLAIFGPRGARVAALGLARRPAIANVAKRLAAAPDLPALSGRDIEGRAFVFLVRHADDACVVLVRPAD